MSDISGSEGPVGVLAPYPGAVTFLTAVIPSLGLALLFWYVMRAVLHADRREREEVARFERANRVAEGDGSSP